MKAVQYSSYGGPDVLSVVEVDVPALQEGQVLIDVHAAAINPFDFKLRSGAYEQFIPVQLPVTIGGDIAGVVTQVSADVTDINVGDAVYGSVNVLGGGSGALAEQAAANRTNIAHQPSSLSADQAASIVLVGVSAIQALDQLNLGPDVKILIHGGAGGIGSIAIQYAKHLGAYVATTARGADAEFVKGLGADEVIDYETQQFEDVLHDYEAVFDTVGGESYDRSLGVLKQGGIIISMLNQPDEAKAKELGITMLSQNTNVNTTSLEKLSHLVADGHVEPKIDKTFSLDQAVEAFTYAETGNPKGKVVITLA